MPPRRRRRDRGSSSADRRDGPGAGAAAGEQDPGAEPDRGEVGAGDGERAGRADLPGRRVDRDDACRRRVDGGTASADHVDEPADRGRGGVRRRRGQRPQPADGARGGIEPEHGGARRPCGQGAAGDHDRAPDRGDSRVANGAREMGDDVSCAARLPGDDGVEPARPRVAADDVRRAADRGCTDVRAGGGQTPGDGDPAGRRIDPEDLVELLRPVAAAEQVDGAADLHRCGVVPSRRQRAAEPVAARRHAEDRARGGIRRREPAEQEASGSGAGVGGILQRRPERARHALGQDGNGLHPCDDDLRGCNLRRDRRRRLRGDACEAPPQSADRNDGERDDDEHEATRRRRRGGRRRREGSCVGSTPTSLPDRR